MPRKKKTRSRYGTRCEVIDGKLYASVNIPLGNGTYQRKRKRVNNETEARQWAIAQLGGDPEPNDKLTFAALGEWYKTEFLVAPFYKDGKRVDGLRTYLRQRNSVDRLSRYFGNYPLNNITVDTLRRYKRERLRTVSITSVNRDFALMRTMFKKACNRKWMLENPFQQSEHLIEISIESKRSVMLTERIAKRLLARSRKSEQPLLHYLILVMKNTGARPSEVMPYDASENDGILREPVTWSNILASDFKTILLVSYKSRVREERLIPTTEELERGLRTFYQKTNPQPDDLLFPVASVKKSWASLCKSVRVSGIVLRDFRRYFNTKLIDSELDEVSRLWILGHKEISTNRRYAAFTAEFLEKYRERVKL